MTEVAERDESPVDEAVTLLEQYAVLTTTRSMFSADEVLNLCLDVRLLLCPLVPDTVEAIEAEEPELVPA